MNQSLPTARPRSKRRSILLNGVLVLAALAIAVAALMGQSDAKQDPPTLDVINRDGVVQMSNSRAGQPILTVENLAPGQSASGQVTLKNTGTARGYFYLRPHGLVSPVGPGGGQLVDNLILRVTLTKGGVTSSKYGGLISKMGTITAGQFSPGESGTYTFEVEAKNTGIPAPPTLSRPVRGDNKYQGTSASVDFRWSTYP